MSDLDWLNSYVNNTATASLASSAPIQPTPVAKSNKPWCPAFPSFDDIAAIRLQLFDNGTKPGKGRSQHVLKMRVYLDPTSAIDQTAPDWERCIQLIAPKKVVEWAGAEYHGGRVPEAVLERYAEAYAAGKSWSASADADWAKMGHISSQPGTQYYPGQFVCVRRTQDGELSASIYVDGSIIEFEKFHPNTRANKSHAPTHHALFDPHGLIDTRRAA